MSSFFTLASKKPAKTDIPITLTLCSEYPSWLEAQTKSVQTWLNSNNYEGKGSCILPNQDGSISRVIYGITGQEGFFIAGELALQLPPGQYLIDQESSQKALLPSSTLLNFLISWGLSCYQFSPYKTTENTKKKSSPTLSVTSQELINEATSYIDSISLVRDLVNTPAGDLMPQDISAQTDQLAKEFNAQVVHIIGDDLLKHNYPTIHAVGRASVHEPRLIDLAWGDEDAPKVTLVGKGVCFDSGGLDLKPTNAMRLMKKDMGGAAHVLGLAKLIMSQNLPVRLRVLIPAVENAVSANAFRPGDVITTRQGITVEIDNTDAEGRLVLCDALTEADSESPDIIIDFATLTGACRVAVGTEIAGMFTNHKDVAAGLIESGLNVHDPVWQLPLHAPYQDMLKSDIADTLNSAPTGFGGAITAALYLQLFVSKETQWVHFDIMAWNLRKLPGRPVGGEAFGIRATFEYLNQRFR
jgi:leucyl aminopeptidase